MSTNHGIGAQASADTTRFKQLAEMVGIGEITGEEFERMREEIEDTPEMVWEGIA